MSTTDLSGSPKGPLTQEHITGWTPKAKGALAGCVITALLGMLTVVWVSPTSLFSLAVVHEHGQTDTDCSLVDVDAQYAVGGQLDIEELEDEVRRKLEEKNAAGGGYLKRGFNAVTGRNKRAEL